jgi:L-lactate dehydrogenase
MRAIRPQQEHEIGEKEQCNPRKVVIVGAGDVGTFFAYALLQSGTAESTVLIDKRYELAEGQAFDLAHGNSDKPVSRQFKEGLR